MTDGRHRRSTKAARRRAHHLALEARSAARPDEPPTVWLGTVIARGPRNVEAVRTRLGWMFAQRVGDDGLRIRRRGADGFRLSRANLSRSDLLLPVVRARIVDHGDRVEIVARVRPALPALLFAMVPVWVAMAVVPPWSLDGTLVSLGLAAFLAFLGWLCLADFRADMAKVEGRLCELVAGHIVERRNKLGRARPWRRPRPMV